MGAALGLTLAAGLLLAWFSGPRARPLRLAWDVRWERRRTAWLREAGVRGVSAWQLLGVQVASVLVSAVVVLTATGSPAIAACFGLFGFLAPTAIVNRLLRRRREELRDAWPEVVDNLTSAVRAGMGLPEAVGALAAKGPEPLRPAFGRFAAEYRATGRFTTALDRLRDDLADPVGDRVCEALRLARDVGGSDLGRLLRTLSTFLREDARTRGELLTRQGWTVNAARLAVAAPWLVLLLLGMQPSTLEAYDSPGGRLLLAVGGAVTLLAYRLMTRIGRLPEEGRVLR